MLAVLVGSAFAAPSVGFECEARDAGGSVRWSTREGGGSFTGVPPIEVHCALLPSVGTWDAVVWLPGNGEVVEGDELSVVYDEVGRYSVSVELEGYVGPLGPAIAEHVEYNAITACGPPIPDFGWDDRGGLEYGLSNRSEIVPGCLSSSQWDVFRGDLPVGTPIRTTEAWEPVVRMPGEGRFTVRLTQSGIAGTDAIAKVLHARDSLGDVLEQPVNACSTTPIAGTWLGLTALAWFARRRRRS